MPAKKKIDGSENENVVTLAESSIFDKRFEEYENVIAELRVRVDTFEERVLPEVNVLRARIDDIHKSTLKILDEIVVRIGLG